MAVVLVVRRVRTEAIEVEVVSIIRIKATRRPTITVDAGTSVLTNIDAHAPAVHNIASAPLYYVRSGVVDIGTGYFRVIGGDVRGWSSHSSSNDQAYSFYFNTGTLMNPSYDGSRYVGRSLRCLSTV